MQRFILAVLIASFGMGQGIAVGDEDLPAPNHVTGCLAKNGQIRKLTTGDSPLKRCRRNEVIITLETAISGSMEVPFKFGIDYGEGRYIISSGALEVFTRCELLDNGQSLAQIIVQSNEDDWFAPSNISGGQQPLPAGEAVMLGTNGAAVPFFFVGNAGRPIAIGPHGETISIDVGMVAQGREVFGSDCFFIGTATSTQALGDAALF